MTDPTSPVYGIGIVGLGAMGQEMLEAMAAHPRFQVLTAWDPDAAVMTAALAQARGVAPAESAAEVVARPGLAALYLASPPSTHAEHAHRALDSGLALFCEKPLGVDLEISRALVQRVYETGTPNAVNFNHAAALDARTVKSWLDDGELGQPCYVSMRLHLPRWPRPFQAHARWLAGREQGGFSREMLSHWFYLSRKLLGAGRIVHARTRYPDDPVASEVAVNAELSFGGTPAYVNAAVGGAGPVGMEYTLYATDSSARLTSGGGLARWGEKEWVEVQGESDPGEDDNDRARALTQFAAMLDGKENTSASVADAFAVQDLVEGVLASC